MGDSPAKKLNFSAVDKENNNVAIPIVGIPDVELTETKTEDAAPAVAVTIKPEEAQEPLLQENPQRFVLFPIQHHDVSPAGTRKGALRSVLKHQLT